MTDQQKYILLGLVGAGGLAYWYFFYGPGATPAPIAASQGTSTTTPAAVVPAPANGSSVAVPAVVQNFVNSLGPKSQAQWATVIPTLTASNVLAQYQNLASILPYWSAGTTPPSALQAAVDSWFNANGFTNLST
jgi:hypothetical protein